MEDEIERARMKLSVSFVAGLCLAGLLTTSPALAENTPAKDHLSYYTYYRSEQSETVESVADKHGIASSSLIRMNPYLEQFADELPKGTLICVPKEDAPVAQDEVDEDDEGEEIASSDEPTPRKKRRKRKLRDEPTKREWETLADLATKGAPRIASRSPMGAPSRMISSDGHVVYVPAAKPAPAPQRKGDRTRVKLRSRKGKKIHKVLTSCRSYMGTPYVWGGEQPGGFDCSGYVQYVFAKHGYRLPRTADIQFNVGKRVKAGEERPGDLVFFETYAPGASHVGVFLGNGYFIHASSSRGVTIDRLSSEFFAARYLGAKRNI